MWFDMSSLKLAGDQIHLIQHHEALNQPLGRHVETKTSRFPNRWVTRMELGIRGEACEVALTPTRTGEKRPAGCRIVANVFENIVLMFNAVPRVVYIYLTKDSYFVPRGLLTMSRLLRHEARQEILESLSLVNVPALPGERPAAYEDRGVQEVASRYGGYQETHAIELHVKGVSRAQPDGLFLNREENRLLIVEAKHGRPDFAEGTSQVVQYYAQARANPRFADARIASVLVTGDSRPTRGYEAWQTLMNDPGDLQIYVIEQDP